MDVRTCCLHRWLASLPTSGSASRSSLTVVSPANVAVLSAYHLEPAIAREPTT